MAVNLSPIWGAGAQLLDNSGNVLSGGKIYTYLAGTTTNATTYTSNNGNTANSNPIILNSAGRVPYEIWLTDSISYKFVLKDSNDTLIGTWDNLVGINSNFINYYGQQEIQTATAGQTVFTLTEMQYQVGTNSLSVFVDGVNQYGPGAQYAFVETDSTTVTFVSGLHVGASVKFTTTQIQNAGVADASQISYTYPATDAVTESVEDRLAQYVSIIDFGADPTGTADSTTAIINALTEGAITGLRVHAPAGEYNISGLIEIDVDIAGKESIINGGRYLTFTGDGSANTVFHYTGTTTNQILFSFIGDMKEDNFMCQGFRITKPDTDTPGAPSNYGIGLKLEKFNRSVLRDVQISRMDLGLQMFDVLGMHVEDCSFTYNKEGIIAELDTISTPNLIHFDRCTFNSNWYDAVTLRKSICNTFTACAFEGNGIDWYGTVDTGAVALSISYDGGSGRNAINVYGCYFEGNAGTADMFITHLAPGTYNIEGNTFNRVNNVNYTLHNIVVDASTNSANTNPCCLNVTGNGFYSANTYVPSTSRRCIDLIHGAAYNGFYFNDLNNIYTNDIEKTLIFPTQDKVLGNQIAVGATLIFLGNATLVNNYGVNSVTKNSTGDYTIVLSKTYTTPMPFVSSAWTSPLICNVNVLGTTSFKLSFVDASGIPQDPVSVSVIVHDVVV
jgi:hypothetical protein